MWGIAWVVLGADWCFGFFFQGKQKLTTYIVLFIKDEKFSFSDHLTQIYVDPNSVV